MGMTINREALRDRLREAEASGTDRVRAAFELARSEGWRSGKTPNDYVFATADGADWVCEPSWSMREYPRAERMRRTLPQ